MNPYWRAYFFVTDDNPFETELRGILRGHKDSRLEFLDIPLEHRPAVSVTVLLSFLLQACLLVLYSSCYGLVKCWWLQYCKHCLFHHRSLSFWPLCAIDGNIIHHTYTTVHIHYYANSVHHTHYTLQFTSTDAGYTATDYALTVVFKQPDCRWISVSNADNAYGTHVVDNVLKGI